MLQSSRWLMNARLLVVLLLGVCCSESHAERYYVQTGGGHIQAADGDASTIQPREWQVRLYRNGASASGHGHWGLISDKTAAGAMRKLKASQEFQIRYARWAGIDYATESLTYFNPLGPIAVLDPPKSVSRVVKEKAEELYGVYGRLREARERFEQVMAREPKERNPYQGVGSVIRDYSKLLQDVEKRVHEAEAKLRSASGTAEGDMLATLASFERDLQSAGTQSAKFDAAFPPRLTTSASLSSRYSQTHDLKTYGDRAAGTSRTIQDVTIGGAEISVRSQTSGGPFTGGLDVRWQTGLRNVNRINAGNLKVPDLDTYCFSLRFTDNITLTGASDNGPVKSGSEYLCYQKQEDAEGALNLLSSEIKRAGGSFELRR